MIELTDKSVFALRDACRQIGETIVTVATKSGLIEFDFSGTPTKSRELGFETQPNRDQLRVLLSMRLPAEPLKAEH